MKIILAENVDAEITATAICEGVEGGPKQWYVEGIFCQGDILNKNGRIYPISVLDQAVNSFNEEFVSKNRGVGELKHPPTLVIDQDRISHRIISLTKQGNNYVGKAKVLNSPTGKILQALLEGEVSTGFSTRGGGTVTPKGAASYVDPGYRIVAVDSVFNPSAPDAFVTGLMEGANFVWDTADVDHAYLESIKNSIRRTNSKMLLEAKLDAFKAFLNAVNIK